MGSLSLQQRQREQTAYYAQLGQQRHQEQAREVRQLQQPQAACYASQMQQTHRHDTAQAQAEASRSRPEYVKSQTGTPINVRDGVAVTVARGIFVSGISYKAREEDVKRKFSSVGDIVRCVLLMNTSTGKSKGFATILFSSSADAQKAINKYNGATWLEKKLIVRVDKEASTLTAPPRSDTAPLIVNGSRVQ